MPAQVTKPFQKSKPKLNTVKRIWSYLSTNFKLLLAVLGMVLASSLLGLLGPYLLGVTVDKYIVTKENTGIFVPILLLVGIYILHSVALWYQNYWMVGIAQKTVFTMRTELFNQLHRLPIHFFDKRQHGELMSRVTNDIENVSSTLNSSVIQIFSSLLTLIGTIVIMVWLSPLLTLITLLIVPIMFFGLKWITNRTGKLFKEQQRYLGDLNGYIEETISGQRIVKSFSQEEKVIQEFLDKSEKLKRAGYFAQTYSGFIPKLMNVLNNLSFAIIAGIGGVFAIQKMITIGTIVIFTEYARQFTRPLNDLANQFNTLLSAIAGAERVFDILDEELETWDEINSTVVQKVHGEVEFRNVSFSYEKGGNTIDNVSFHVDSGTSVALVGPTGAGKTTIINLLSRFYDPDGGMIFIDGIDSVKITRGSLRKNMAFVLQDSYLFQVSIMENIRYGRLNATDEEIIEAAKLANAHSFIMKLPNKYDTILKQDGNGISQGQKQLLSIARAIIANPAILILDEATSSIDTVTEVKIQEALQRLMNGRTSFIVAHRLNTIQQADQILVLDEGKMIEKGTHESLLQQKGYYHTLFNSQLKKKVM
ncbi:ABC transporter ATP-binding protein [Ferdinandcohnia quinoae]|uniref:ABC transporter ATP-binding protein/permease n=1 Tax=Fredinandcohnia quinoae TaxID=2918902 RepID=A0AAW5E4Z8_9BACI|nr:ABC transporter ATP-binding protein [Fredinandcohnia sp. SECRCQ15]MCH1626315.1 ABC transporter ATP-binding protein/permease [Fredinandcohnia sp. SECRCQ15]